MNTTNILKQKVIALLCWSAICLFPTFASALNLTAIESKWYPPDGAPPVTMWGFINDLGQCPVNPDYQWWTGIWTPGPLLKYRGGQSLSITLRNCLSEPVSLIIPGLESELTPQTFVDSKGRTRVRAFTKEVPPDGTTLVTYTWKNLRPGTFLYQSGSQPAKQVHMGLYGAVTIGREKDADNEAIILFSEIDPALHATTEAATPRNYKPKYYLINGESGHPGWLPPRTFGGREGQTVHLRFLNAGLMTHVPTLQGPYMKIVAEDGNHYNYPKEQYSVLLPAGKTIDALWHPDNNKFYTLYDRRLSMTTNGQAGGGMINRIEVPGFPWHIYMPSIMENAKQ